MNKDYILRKKRFLYSLIIEVIILLLVWTKPAEVQAFFYPCGG